MKDRIDAVRIDARRRKARAALVEVRKPGERFRWLTGLRTNDNLYLVSNLGRVFEVFEYPRNKRYRGRFEPLVVADESGLGTGPGPVRVRIFRRNGRSKAYDLAWLVAKRFLPSCLPGRILVHKDGDSTNCCADNLRWRREKRRS